MNPGNRLIYWLLVGCFFGSGIAGLSYQVVWTRYLALFLGHTSYAVVAVLVAFMGGLALGNAWLGSVADRAKRPLAFYGWLEIGIGVYALVFPNYFELCREGFIALARPLTPGGIPLLALKFLFSLLTILLPTILMGATLPALTRFITKSLTELRARVAWLYCINSAGAVGGCVLADFWLLPMVGLEMTVYAGALLNLLAGLATLLLSRQLEAEGGAGRGAEVVPATESGQETFAPSEIRLALWGIGISGFVAMLYEVAWTRLLALALGSSTHAFTVMVMTFISGITLGSGLIARWKLRNTLTAFGWAELALASTLLLSLFFYEFLPFLFIRLAALLSRTPESYPFYGMIQMGVCFLVMLIPTACLGMTIPLVSRIATAELSHTGRSIGRVFAVNTVATVLGAALTGLILMPKLGLPKTFAIGIALNFAIALRIVGRGRWAEGPGFLPALGVGGAVLVLAAGSYLDEPWIRSFNSEFWRNPKTPQTWSEFKNRVKNSSIKYHKDGASGTVVVLGFKEPRNGSAPPVENLVLKVNGKSDAGTKNDVPTQLLSGHIPMLLKPDSERVLVVGMGSGMTCGAITRHDSMKHMDVVEISPEVAEAARLFHPFSDNALDDPRVKVVVEDAKTFMQLNTNLYDIIVSEPSNPWMAGVANVFSREYYTACKEHLKPGGLMAQWVQLYESSDDIFDMVINTFATSFPYISYWHGAASDMILIGSTTPPTVDMAATVARMREEKVARDLARIGITRPVVFFRHQIVAPEVGAHLPPVGGITHSDYYPTLEFEAQKAFFVRGMVNKWRAHDLSLKTISSGLLAQYLKQHPLEEADFEALVGFFGLPGNNVPSLNRSLLSEWLRKNPGNPRPRELETQLYAYGSVSELATHRLADLPTTNYAGSTPSAPVSLVRLQERLMMEAYRDRRSVFHKPDTQRLEALAAALVTADPLNQSVYRLHLAELASDRGDTQTCLRIGREVLAPATATPGAGAFDHDPTSPHVVLERMIESAWREGNAAVAHELGELALRRGYAGNNPPGSHLPLDVAVRRVAAAIVAAGVPAQSVAAPASNR